MAAGTDIRHLYAQNVPAMAAGNTGEGNVPYSPRVPDLNL